MNKASITTSSSVVLDRLIDWRL